MVDAFTPVMAHGPIKQAFDDVYVVQGSVNMGPLVRITRQMTIVAQSEQLTLINAVRLSPAGESELAKLGRVAHVMKIGAHGMDDAYYVHRHGAKLWAADGAILSDGLVADQTIAADTKLPVADMTAFLFDRTIEPEVVLLLARSGGIVVSCDCVQNWVDTKGCSIVAKLVARLMGFLRPAQIGPPWRKRMTRPGDSLRADFERLAALPFQHLIGGHGVPLELVARQKLVETIERVYGAKSR